MEAEATHTGHGHRLRNQGEVVMERGVEARDLRNARKRLAGQPDPREGRRLMAGRKHSGGFDVGEHGVVDQ